MTEIELPDGYAFATVAERPDLAAAIDETADRCWPEFMLHDPVCDGRWGKLYEAFPEYQFALLDQEGRVVASGNSLPLAWEGDPADLPETGWDWVMKKGFDDQADRKQPTVQSALSIPILPEYRGKGLSKFLVAKMKAIGEAHRLKRLIVPARPNVKHRYPLIPIEEYARWTGENGLPFDPWLRVHARLGARIVKVCPQSMTIPGSVADWEAWAGLRFPAGGRYIVPEALAPVEIDRLADRGIYIEPNVWMVHEGAQS